MPALETLPWLCPIQPYQPGRPIGHTAAQLGLSAQSIVKLASNENPWGMSSQARAAIQEAAIHRYPDADAFFLKAALSADLKIPADQITLGNGSNDLLALIAQAVLAPGKTAISSQYGFVVYHIVTQIQGANSCIVPAHNFGHDLEAMLAHVDEDTRVVFIANPNNPTGSRLTDQALYQFLDQLPSHIWVVLDQAYQEYLALSQDPSLGWLDLFPNLIITRSFSKAYGLAGLRIGYSLSSAKMAQTLNTIRPPFNTSVVAQAGAQAALQDQSFIQHSVQHNQKGLEDLSHHFDRLSLNYLPSQANFICFQHPQAASLFQALLKHGVIVRPLANYDLSEWLRVSVGTPPENERFCQALTQTLAAGLHST